MTAWDDDTTIANSKTFQAGETASADVEGYHSPAVCVNLESLNSNAEDTITIGIVGAAATYDVDSRTLSSLGSYVVDVPQCDRVEVSSSNGTTLSCEARNNPR